MGKITTGRMDTIIIIYSLTRFSDFKHNYKNKILFHYFYTINTEELIPLLLTGML